MLREYIKMNSIGPRLEAALSLLASIGKTDIFADIGSDHAYLASECLKRELCREAIASDIRKGPLETGKKNASSYEKKPLFVLSDGFEALENRNITAAAVCGMGGELIKAIIEKSETAKKIYLILQPMTKQEALREFLWTNGFEIKKEIFVSENRKPYSVMLVRFTGKNTEFSYPDTFLGLLREKNPEFIMYTEKVLSAAEKRLRGEEISGENTENTLSLIKECHKQITSF